MADDPSVTNPAVDVLGFLDEAVWRDVSFPTTKFRMTIAHDLAEHKYWGVDGARVESTGLAPLRFTFSAPLTTGIAPGGRETWVNLYPVQFRKLVASFQRKDKDYLTHPEFGRILCKAERMDIDWNAERRGGAECELSFVATIDDNASDAVADSPVTAINNLKAFDDPEFKVQLAALFEASGIKLPLYLRKPSVSLSDMISDIKAIAGYPALLSLRSNPINTLLFHAKEIAAAAEKSKSAFSWPMTQQAEKTKEAAYDLQDQALKASKSIGVYVVPATTTLSGAAQQISAAKGCVSVIKLSDIFTLNPAYVAAGIIEAGSPVRYYL